MKKRVTNDAELDTPINWDWVAKQKPLTREDLGLPSPEEMAKMPRVRVHGGNSPQED